MISQVLKKLKTWIFSETKIASLNWHAWLSVFGAFFSILGVGLTLVIWKYPIQEIQQEIKNAKYDFTKVFNEQAIDTSKMNGNEIIQQYYNFLNPGDYQKACSLRATQECTLYDVNKFTQWVDNQKRYLTIKLNDGERLEKVWFSGEKLENTNAETWCARLSYRMNSEIVDVSKVNQYAIATRPDRKKEIRKILCEGEVKRGVSTNNCKMESQVCVNSEPK